MMDVKKEARQISLATNQVYYKFSTAAAAGV